MNYRVLTLLFAMLSAGRVAFAATPKVAVQPSAVVPPSGPSGKPPVGKLIPALGSAPPAPAGFTATAGTEQVALAWTQPTAEGAAPVDTYLLQRSTDGTTWSDVATIPPTGRKWFDPQRAPGVGLSYRLFANSASGIGASSAIVTATPFGPASPPAVVQVAISGDRRLNILWGVVGGVVQTYANGASAVTSYVVQRSTDGRTWTDHGTLQASDGVRNGHGLYRPGGYGFTDSNLTPGARLSYRVIAVNGAGRGAPSAPVEGVAGTFPGGPESLKMTVSWGLVSLKWDPPKNSGGTQVTQYKIEVWRAKVPNAAPGGDGYWWPLAAVPGGSGTAGSFTSRPSCSVPAGVAGVNMDIGCPLSRKWYRVTTVNAVGDSAPSNWVTGVL
ncbi:MAG: hypothetical protein KF764_05650 [Labilithrix sp.]|nr:hypothetical protein [Labilithrix sp.]